MTRRVVCTEFEGKERDLILVIFHEDRLQIFGFVHLTAVQASHIIDSIAAGKHLSSIVIARTFHRSEHPHCKDIENLVKPPRLFRR